jgi:hypothetical protein
VDEASIRFDWHSTGVRARNILNSTQLETLFNFCEKHSTTVDTYIYISTHLYEYIYAHPIPMSSSERLSRLDLKIHEVGHQERLAVEGTSPPTERIISHKYNTHIKF